MSSKVNYKSGVVLLPLIFVFIIMVLLAPGITILLSSALAFIFALLIAFKDGFFEKYLAFINLSYYEKYSAKGSSYMKKKRILQSIVFFLFAALNGFNGYRILDSYEGSNFLAVKVFIPYTILTIIFFGLLFLAFNYAKDSIIEEREEE
ncbi:MAG: hypothetical protein GX958_01195 [Desulfitobacterium sp.]|nr:hypothetical protein [Desulfitobacterium sp.]